ncbi:MAG: hypothetical protein HFJ34_06915 [Clostridia bacterium]|nr:hypothetical protein [Clostridia bacterium]
MKEDIKIRDIIELIYRGEEKILDEKIKEVNKKVKDKIKEIDIKDMLEDTSRHSELEKMFEKIEENYSIKIAEYNKEFYKQGLIDGIHLMINCLKT